MQNNKLRTEQQPLIRKAGKSDLTALCDIEENNFPSDRLSRRQMLYHIKNPKALFLVAASSVDNAPLGYILVFLPKHRSARIYSIATQKKMQGKGLGRMLLNHACGEIQKRHIRKIILEVRKADRDTIRFYDSAGFIKTRDLPVYYEDGADGIKMQKSLEEP